MCFIDLDPCELWQESRRKARKEHQCDSCERTIRPGETYLIHFSVFEGRATSEKMCLECEVDREQFADGHDGMLMSPSSFPPMLRECIGEQEEGETDWRPMLERIRERGREST